MRGDGSAEPGFAQVRRDAGRSDSAVAVGAIAVLAYMLADVVHEAVGHGGACWLAGRDIAVLSSAFFRCAPPTRFADVGGPVANLAAAALFWLALRARQDQTPLLRLFLVLAFGFDLFWCSGQMIYSAALRRDDWYFALEGLAPDWLWRPALVLIGGALYGAAMRTLARELRRFGAGDATASRQRIQRILLVSYASAGLMACLAALLYGPDPLGAAREAALETFAANCGLLILARRNSFAEAIVAQPVPGMALSARWLALTAMVFCLFSAALGRGF